MAVAYDFSVVPGPDPVLLKQSGAEGVLVYSFNARQSDDYLNRCRDLGLKVVWIWERNVDSILFMNGAVECRAHEASAKPGELTYVACDLNNGALNGRDVTRFCREWASVTREAEFGLYGSQDAIAQGQRSGIAKLTRWWGVVNWITGGGPNNDPANIRYWGGVGAHLVQLIGSPIPNTDENLILRPEWATIGAPAPTPEDDDVAKANIFIRNRADDGKAPEQQEGIYVTDDLHGVWKRHVRPGEWKLANDLAAYAKQPAPVVHSLDPDHWASIPTAVS